MKLGIIVGHEKRAKGAFSPWLNASEYDWNTELGRMMLQVSSPIERKLIFRDNVGISGAYAISDQWGSDVTVELHFNSSDNESATGTAMLYFPGSGRGRMLAGLLFEETNKVLKLGEWPKGTGGVVTPLQASGRAQNGLTNLRAGRAPASLLEPFFGSNQKDCAAAAKMKPHYAAAVIRAVEHMLVTS